MEKKVKIPEYSVEIRFENNIVHCYDLLLKKIVDSKVFKKDIKQILKQGSYLFSLLGKMNRKFDEMRIDITLNTKKIETGAGYIFGIEMDKPNHGFYIGTYEIGEFYYSDKANLINPRSYSLDYCSRGLISPSKVFYLGLRDSDSEQNYLVKLDWKKTSEPFIEWKKPIPSAIMSILLIENFLFVGLRDGTLQIWDIKKEECIQNSRIFKSTISIIEKVKNKLFIGSSTGEVASLSLHGKIVWKINISQHRINGIFESENGVVIIDRKGKCYLTESTTGKIIFTYILELEGVRDPSISSNLIFIRDWFVLSGDASIWAFWTKDQKKIFFRYSEDPLIRRLYPNPLGFFTGDDDGCISFWKIGFKIISVKEESKRFKKLFR
jgi:WD40 repeat protein